MSAESRATAAIGELLHKDESLLVSTSGFLKSSGVLALTDRRLMFVRQGRLTSRTEDWPLHQVTSIEWHKGMVNGKVQIHAASSVVEVTLLDKKVGADLVAQARDLIGTHAQPTAPVAVAGDSIASQLRELGDLHASGVLDDDEFAAAKAQLLG